MESKVSEGAEPERSFSGFLSKVLAGERFSFQNCPKDIAIQGSELEAALVRFKREMNEQLVEGVKQAKRGGPIKIEGNLIRIFEEQEWSTEYFQTLFVDKQGRLTSTPVEKGAPGRSFPGNHYDRATENQQRVFIHLHPEEGGLNETDLQEVFLSLNPSQYLGREVQEQEQEQEQEPPPLSAMIAIDDKGTYLTFPTQETIIPTQEELVGRPGEGKDWDSETLALRYVKVWMDLKTQYRDKLERFMGRRWKSRGIFPEKVNTQGAGLIVLANLLHLGAKYKLPLYFCPKGESQFSRVDSVTDVYQSLKITGLTH